MIDQFQAHPDADQKHSASCSCPQCSPDAKQDSEEAINRIKDAHKAGDRIAELVSGSRGRIKWKWSNKHSPFRMEIERMAKRPPVGSQVIPKSQPEALYRLITQPKNRNKGGDTTANKAAVEALRILEMAEKLRATGEIEQNKITTTILERWHRAYPNTKRPSRRTISRNLTGK